MEVLEFSDLPHNKAPFLTVGGFVVSYAVFLALSSVYLYGRWGRLQLPRLCLPAIRLNPECLVVFFFDPSFHPIYVSGIHHFIQVIAYEMVKGRAEPEKVIPRQMIEERNVSEVTSLPSLIFWYRLYTDSAEPRAGPAREE